MPSIQQIPTGKVSATAKGLVVVDALGNFYTTPTPITLWQVVTLQSDDFTSAIATGSSALSWNCLSGESYIFKAFLKIKTAAATTGVRIGMAAPTGSTIAWKGVVPLTTSSEVMYYATARNQLVPSTGLPDATNTWYATLEGNVLCGGAGTINVAFSSEVAASQVNIVKGSSMIYLKVF